VWGRIAALATRDPTQSTSPPADCEQEITRGLLKLVYDANAEAAEDIHGWAALAEPILDRIQSDEREYFIAQAGDFVVIKEIFPHPEEVFGKVILFKGSAKGKHHVYPWALEAAIEKNGRALVQGICFNTPYAIVTWADGDMVEMLAINHWLEEEAIPIRLNYPANLGLIPVGNESNLQIRLPADQVDTIIEMFIRACNQEEKS